MGYEIMYNWQFLRSKEGLTPVVLSGSNNVTVTKRARNGRLYESGERDWWCLFNLIGVTDEEFLDKIRSMTGKTYQEHWKYAGKWVDDAGLLRWANNAVKNAASIEDVLLLNRPAYLYAEANIIIWPKEGEDGWSRNVLRETIHTTEELDDWIRQAREIITKAKEEKRAVYPIIRYSKEKFLKAKSLPDEIFLQRGKNQYVQDITVDNSGSITGISYSSSSAGCSNALRLTKEEYMKYLSFGGISLLENVRPVSAVGKDGAYDAIIQVTAKYTQNITYLSSTGKHPEVVCRKTHAKRFKNLAEANRVAKKYNERFASGHYSFQGISLN